MQQVGCSAGERTCAGYATVGVEERREGRNDEMGAGDVCRRGQEKEEEDERKRKKEVQRVQVGACSRKGECSGEEKRGKKKER